MTTLVTRSGRLENVHGYSTSWKSWKTIGNLIIRFSLDGSLVQVVDSQALHLGMRTFSAGGWMNLNQKRVHASDLN